MTNQNHCSRRLVLGAMSAGVVAAMGDPGRAAGAKQEPRLRWAQGFLLWRGNKGQTIRDAIDNLAAVGADGIEFTPRKGELEAFGFTRETLLAFLATRNMSISAQYFGTATPDTTRKDEILAEARAQIATAHAFGCPNLVLGPPGNLTAEQNNPAWRRDAIKRWAPLWNEMGRLAHESGVVAGLHPHLNTLVETEAEAELALAETDPRLVRFTPDTGHLYLGGANVLALLRKHAKRLSYFHFKDAARPFVRPTFETSLRELGRGEVDFPSVMRLLKEVGYRGWINVEQDKSTLPPREASAASMAYVKGTLKKIYT